jgi:hypothetical protein
VLKIGIIILLTILFSRLTIANVIINEIMADPLGDDFYDEWVELYNNGTERVNLKNWKIGDEKENDTLQLNSGFENQDMILQPDEYAIITDDFTYCYYKLNYSKIAIKLVVNDSAIGNGLGNSGETLYLYNDNATLIDQVTYDSTTEGRTYAFFDGIWSEMDPTLGYSNNGLFIENTTNNCDWEIKILLNKTLFNNPENFSFRYKVSKLFGDKTNITVITYIKDIYGRIVKIYDSWENETVTHQKTSNKYSPNLDVNTYYITSNLTTQCNDLNLGNNYKEKMFSFLTPILPSDSYLSIEKIYDLGSDNKAKFGQVIRVKTIIYKGNTTKESIKLFIKNNSNERISKETRTNLNAKFTNYTLTLPIQIKPNCDKGYNDGNYMIYIEGLDKTATKEIWIEGISNDMCEIVKESEKKEIKKRIEYLLLDAPEFIEPKKKFEIKLRIINSDNKAHEFSVWSYIYRGSKSYSAGREQNKRTIALRKKETRDIILSNMILDAEPGNNYKLKIKIRKDDKKTAYEITKNIIVKRTIKQEKKQITGENPASLSSRNNNGFTNRLIKENRILNITELRGEVVYESTNSKTQRIIIYFILGLTVMLNVVLIIRR